MEEKRFCVKWICHSLVPELLNLQRKAVLMYKKEWSQFALKGLNKPVLSEI